MPVDSWPCAPPQKLETSRHATLRGRGGVFRQPAQRDEPFRAPSLSRKSHGASIAGPIGPMGRGIGSSMRLALNPHSRRLWSRLPRPTAYTALELALLVLIAVQAARLVWALVTPVDPVGNWRAPAALAPASDSVLAEFDPFFRLSGAGGAGAGEGQVARGWLGVRLSDPDMEDPAGSQPPRSKSRGCREGTGTRR
mgnify:CR=1 FL=1